jgi:hypothetical protein
MVGEDARPIGVVPSYEVEIIHPLKIAINCVVVRHIEVPPVHSIHRLITFNIDPRTRTTCLPPITGMGAQVVIGSVSDVTRLDLSVVR